MTPTLQSRKPTKEQWNEAQLDFVSESRYPADTLQGRPPAERDELKPCPLCPDGNEWNSNGPTGRVCEVCGGYAAVNLDGSKLRREQIEGDAPTVQEAAPR